MTPGEAAVLLGRIARWDRRELTPEIATEWAEALADIPIDRALAVLPQFYRSASRTSRNWIYPGDVADLVHAQVRAEMRDIAADAERAVLAAGGLPDEAWRAAVAALRDYRATVPIELPKQLEAGE